MWEGNVPPPWLQCLFKVRTRMCTNTHASTCVHRHKPFLPGIDSGLGFGASHEKNTQVTGCVTEPGQNHCQLWKP